MNRTAIQLRLARLQQECDVSSTPALLLFATCSALALASGLNGLLEQGAIEPPGQLARQDPPAAARHAEKSPRPGATALLPYRCQAAGARCPVNRDAAV
jgi:hypothetical protein